MAPQLRCWPGCLAVTTHEAHPGLRVIVVERAPDGPFMLPHGVYATDKKRPSHWIVKAEDPDGLPLASASGRVTGRVPFAVCDDKWLQPVVTPAEVA